MFLASLSCLYLCSCAVEQTSSQAFTLSNGRRDITPRDSARSPSNATRAARAARLPRRGYILAMQPIALPSAHSSTLRRQLAGVKYRDSCDSCAHSKVRCSREKPECRRCIGRGTTCTYSETRRIGRPRNICPPTAQSAVSHLDSDRRLRPVAMPAPVARPSGGVGTSALLNQNTDRNPGFSRAGRGAASVGTSAVPYTTMPLVPQLVESPSRSYFSWIDVQNIQATMPNGITAPPSLPNSSSGSGSSSTIDEHVVHDAVLSPCHFSCCCISAILDALRNLYTGTAFSPAPTLSLLPVGFERNGQIMQLNKTLALLYQIAQCRCLLDVDVVSMLKPIVSKTVDGCVAVVHTIHNMGVAGQTSPAESLLLVSPWTNTAGGVHYPRNFYHAIDNGLDSISRYLVELEQRIWPFATPEDRLLEDRLLLDQLMVSMTTKVLLARQTTTVRSTE